MHILPTIIIETHSWHLTVLPYLSPSILPLVLSSRQVPLFFLFPSSDPTTSHLLRDIMAFDSQLARSWDRRNPHYFTLLFSALLCPFAEVAG